jgi:hypothetical protein
MKKLLCVLLTALLLFSACLLSGCGLIDAFSNKVPTTYDNAEKYTAGNGEFEGKVDTFFIWWLYGSVTLKTHKENTVKIEESANKELTDDFRLHWRYLNASDYGNVLYIRYSASGNFDYGDLQKDITVYLPENDDMDLSFTIEAAAVNVDVSTFENTLEELSISTNSGKVSAKIDSADEVRISGQNEEDVPAENREFFFRASGTVEDLGISTSYAKVDVAAKSVYSGEVGSVFADLIFAADSVKDIKLLNSRNKIHATVLHFESIDIETCDGACELMLSPDASFVLSIKEKDRFNHKMSPKNVSIAYEGVAQNGAQYTVGSGEKKIAIATDNDLLIHSFSEVG